MLNIIYRNARRLQLLTDDIVDVAKIESKTLKLNKVEFNLNDVINTAIQDHQDEITKSGKQLELISKSDDSNLTIVGDENRIYQVISNLIDNAVKFTSEGPIKINTSTTDNGNRGKHITVDVRDSGTGIEENGAIFGLVCH